MPSIAVLGCGWSGLLMSIKLKNLYPASEVICIDKKFDGGLLRSESIKEYVFDTGGSHVLFSKKQEIINSIIAMGGEWVFRERMSYIFLDGVYVPYPFENGIYALPPDKRARYGLSLIRALKDYRDVKPPNFKEWILATFGREVAEDYLFPYNEKIWKRPLDQMTADWVYIPGRLPIPSLEDIVKAVAGIPTVGYKENALFYYPRKGGIIKQWEIAFKRSKELGVRFLKTVVKDVKVSSDGYIINGMMKVNKIVSTLPLKESPSIFDLSEESHKASERLDYNSVAVVGIGLKKPAPKQHWIYVPDKKIVFHRYAWISNYGEDSNPGKSALIAEITIPNGKEIDTEELKERVIHDFVRIDVIKETEIDVVEIWFHKYGYPIYTLTHKEDTEVIIRELIQKGIVTFGRWGEWQYWNTDKIYEKAMEKMLVF
jgi:protoporphyrinogen oxidase